MPANQEVKYDPNAMQADDTFDEDLGEFESYVDKLEAEGDDEETITADAEDTELESDESETVAEDAEETDETEAEGELDDADESEDGEEDTDDAEGLEGEAGAEAEAEPDPEDTLADPAENPLIPRERLNQANRKRQEESDRANRLEQELAQMKAQMEVSAQEAGVTDIDPAVLKNAAEKALDGDTEAFSTMLGDQLAKITENMSSKQQKLYEKARQDAVAEIRQEQLNKERVDSAAVWEEIYPELDPNSANLNEDALDEAISLVGMYEQKGYSPAVAMERAVKSVAVNFDLNPAEDTTVTPAKPAKKTVKKRAKKAPVNQPPPTGQGGASKTESPGINPEDMSQDEWDALPESVRENYLMN